MAFLQSMYGAQAEAKPEEEVKVEAQSFGVELNLEELKMVEKVKALKR